jgi:hypothetical protein
MKKILFVLFLSGSILFSAVFPSGTVVSVGNIGKAVYVTNLTANGVVSVFFKLTIPQIVSYSVRQDPYSTATGLTFKLYVNTIVSNVDITNRYTNGFSSDVKGLYINNPVTWAYSTVSNAVISNIGTLYYDSYISRVGEYSSDPIYYPSGYHMIVLSNTYTNPSIINVLINFQK